MRYILLSFFIVFLTSPAHALRDTLYQNELWEVVDYRVGDLDNCFARRHYRELKPGVMIFFIQKPSNNWSIQLTSSIDEFFPRGDALRFDLAINSTPFNGLSMNIGETGYFYINFSNRSHVAKKITAPDTDRLRMRVYSNEDTREVAFKLPQLAEMLAKVQDCTKEKRSAWDQPQSDLDMMDKAYGGVNIK